MAFDGAHGLSATFTVDAGYEAFAVSAFLLFEAQRQASLARVSASAACICWATRAHSGLRRWPCVADRQHLPLMPFRFIPVDAAASKLCADLHILRSANGAAVFNPSRFDAIENRVELVVSNSKAIVFNWESVVCLEEVQGQPLVNIDGEKWTRLRFPASNTQKLSQEHARSSLVSCRNNEMIKMNRQSRLMSRL